MVSITKATIADIPVIRGLAMQVWPQTYTPIVGEEQVAYMLQLFYSPAALEQQMEQGHQFIICCSEGSHIAFAAWSETERGIAKLHKLYILPGQQGKGIGRSMLNYITEELKAQGITALRLNVNRYNHSAIAFYEKVGFTHYMDEDIDIGNGYFMNDHVLSKSLIPALSQGEGEAE